MKKICNSFIDFIRYIEEADEFYTKSNPNNTLLFRGHSNFNFSLLPSAFRNNESNEYSDIHNIQIEYPEEFNKFDHLSNLVKMQHYGVKTRLLDLTRNPLIALYFAACENQDVNGEVFVFKCKKEEIDVMHELDKKDFMSHAEYMFTVEAIMRNGTDVPNYTIHLQKCDFTNCPKVPFFILIKKILKTQKLKKYLDFARFSL